MADLRNRLPAQRGRSRCRSWASVGPPASRRHAGQWIRILGPALLPSEPVLVLDDLPERVLVGDLVALEAVNVAALIVQLLAVRAFAAHSPQRHRLVARDDVVLAVPAHVGDLLEAVGERPAD